MKKNNFLKIFIFFYIIFVFVLNWNDISWVFNYKFLSSYISNIFTFESKNNSSSLAYAKEFDTLYIPKIEVSAPIVFSPTANKKDIEASLKKGVLHYPSSVLPGEQGETIILGHSAPNTWPKINYYYVFNRLNELEKGDKIFINFQNKKYTYQVTKKFFVDEGEKVEYKPLTSSKSILVLISCWPPNKGNQRIIIQAE